MAFGVGTTDMANAFVTGAVRVAWPQSVRVELAGALSLGVMAKDVVLHLLALPTIRDGGGVGEVFEFAGEGVQALSTVMASALAGELMSWEGLKRVSCTK